MALTPAERILHVEGNDDRHVIIHLLEENKHLIGERGHMVDIKVTGNDRGVLSALGVAVKAAAGKAVGFILDADQSIGARWGQICAELKPIGLNMPEVPPADGFIGEANSLRARVGVWLMPDNQRDPGKLEDLLRTLVPTGDTLYAIAERSTGEAVKEGAQFSGNDRIKATLHCWLAWQECPGLPYGTAIKAKFFKADSPAARQFMDWFKRLYQL